MELDRKEAARECTNDGDESLCARDLACLLEWAHRVCVANLANVGEDVLHEQVELVKGHVKHKPTYSSDEEVQAMAMEELHGEETKLVLSGQDISLFFLSNDVDVKDHGHVRRSLFHVLGDECREARHLGLLGIFMRQWCRNFMLFLLRSRKRFAPA